MAWAVLFTVALWVIQSLEKNYEIREERSMISGHCEAQRPSGFWAPHIVMTGGHLRMSCTLHLI